MVPGSGWHCKDDCGAGGRALRAAAESAECDSDALKRISANGAEISDEFAAVSLGSRGNAHGITETDWGGRHASFEDGSLRAVRGGFRCDPQKLQSTGTRCSGAGRRSG